MSDGTAEHTPVERYGQLQKLRRAAALVYVADLDAPVAAPDDAHHLLDVLRLRPDEVVVACDGRGTWRACRVRAESGSGRRRGTPRGRAVDGHPTGAELEPVGPLTVAAQPSHPLTVAFAMTKGDRPEWTVQKLTEIGVDHIVPLLTRRTVVRLGPQERERRADKLRRVAREAGAQSRRTHLPEVAEPVAFERALERLPSASLVAEPGGGFMDPGTRAVLVGPEGGWDPAELACGLGRVDLGPSVLRADTAALVAAALLGAARSGAVLLPAGRAR